MFIDFHLNFVHPGCAGFGWGSSGGIPYLGPEEETLVYIAH